MTTPTTGAGPVRTELRGHVLVVTIDRYHRRNAIDRATADALDEAFNRMDDDPGIRCGILTGERVFSAGSDLTAGGDYVTERGGEYGLVRRLRSTPLIAAVEGLALGGGLELLLACDLVVAARDARFGLPEVTIGLVPTCGALFRGPRALPHNVARELVLTGDPLPATRAHELGLVNRLAEPGEAMAGALELAGRIGRNAPLAVRACLAATQRAIGSDEEGWAATDGAAAAIRASADAAEGVAAFLAKRPPVWTGR